MLHLNEITVRISGRVLMERATVAVTKGQKAGLIGPNGTGKSTLLKIIRGDLQPDNGSVSTPNGIRIGWVEQDVADGNISLLDAVLASDRERARLLLAAETATDPYEVAEIHTRLADIGAHAAPARAGAILAGLGFDATIQDRKVKEFSGGWRMRVALAGALFAEPDLLLLDEPTNHLDLEAALWLENYLKEYRHTIVMVSHDRGLLNSICSHMLHIEDKRLYTYRGNYDQFERQRRERNERSSSMQAKQLQQRREIESFVARFRATASKAKQAQSRLKALARMEPIASIAENRTISFDFPQPETLSSPIMTMENIMVGYDPNTPILKDITLRIDMDDRIALLGANGNGKSTLARLLSGRLKPFEGEMLRSNRLKIGYFAQMQAEELSLELTALAQMMERQPMMTEQKARSNLARFGFGPEKCENKIATLSGGEKARLLFALMCMDNPQLIILDEPTNHLDIDSREALVRAINAFDGAVILITHDPHLVDMVADRLWLVRNGGVETFEGDLQEYRKLLIEQRRAEQRTLRLGVSDKNNGERNEDRAERKENRRQTADSRAAIHPLKKAVEQAEKQVDKLTKIIARINIELVNPDLYTGTGQHQKISELKIKLANSQKELTAAQDLWLEASTNYEEALAQAS
jgi:ATP-binding cassette subfamily F protein 3